MAKTCRIKYRTQAARLKELRMGRDLAVQHVAAGTQMHPMRIHRLESGLSEIKVSELWQLEAFFKERIFGSKTIDDHLTEGIQGWGKTKAKGAA